MNEVVKIIVSIFLLSMIAFGAKTIQTARNSYEPTERITREDYRPNLRECPEESPLWECIRHAEYLKD